MKTKIYALRENGFVKYVGKTIQSLEYRLARHLQGARRGDDTKKDRWICRMLRQGLAPTISLLSEVEGNGNSEEIAWIKYFRDHGVELTNISDGGDGAGGEAMRKLMQKVWKRPSIKKNHAKAMKKLLLRKEWHEAISNAQKGRKITWSDKISKTSMGHPGASKGEHRSRSTVMKLKKVWQIRKANGWISPLKGRKQSETQKENMRLSWIERKRKAVSY